MTLPGCWRLWRVVSVCLVAGVGSACGEEENPRVCPGVVYPSVEVDVVDARGADVCDARVTFTVDGGPEQEAQRTTRGLCSRWSTAWERAGVHVVTATSADGLRSVTGQVTVTQGECNVRPESLTLVLPD